MLSINRTKDENGVMCLHLSGEATIQSATMLRDVLVEAIREKGPIRLNLAQVSELDLTVFQLFCSAHRTAHFEKIPLFLDAEMPVSVVEDLRSFGFERNWGCSHCPDPSSCIWAKESSEC